MHDFLLFFLNYWTIPNSMAFLLNYWAISYCLTFPSKLLNTSRIYTKFVHCFYMRILIFVPLHYLIKDFSFYDFFVLVLILNFSALLISHDKVYIFYIFFFFLSIQITLFLSSLLLFQSPIYCSWLACTFSVRNPYDCKTWQYV